eukprot:gene6539-4714_t
MPTKTDAMVSAYAFSGRWSTAVATIIEKKGGKLDTNEWWWRFSSSLIFLLTYIYIYYNFGFSLFFVKIKGKRKKFNEEKKQTGASPSNKTSDARSKLIITHRVFIEWNLLFFCCCCFEVPSPQRLSSSSSPLPSFVLRLKEEKQERKKNKMCCRNLEKKKRVSESERGRGELLFFVLFFLKKKCSSSNNESPSKNAPIAISRSAPPHPAAGLTLLLLPSLSLPLFLILKGVEVSPLEASAREAAGGDFPDKGATDMVELGSNLEPGNPHHSTPDDHRVDIRGEGRIVEAEHNNTHSQKEKKMSSRETELSFTSLLYPLPHFLKTNGQGAPQCPATQSTGPTPLRRSLADTPSPRFTDDNLSLNCLFNRHLKNSSSNNNANNNGFYTLLLLQDIPSPLELEMPTPTSKGGEPPLHRTRSLGGGGGGGGDNGAMAPSSATTTAADFMLFDRINAGGDSEHNSFWRLAQRFYLSMETVMEAKEIFDSYRDLERNMVSRPTSATFGEHYPLPHQVDEVNPSATPEACSSPLTSVPGPPHIAAQEAPPAPPQPVDSSETFGTAGNEPEQTRRLTGGSAVTAPPEVEALGVPGLQAFYLDLGFPKSALEIADVIQLMRSYPAELAMLKRKEAAERELQLQIQREQALLHQGGLGSGRGKGGGKKGDKRTAKASSASSSPQPPSSSSSPPNFADTMPRANDDSASHTATETMAAESAKAKGLTFPMFLFLLQTPLSAEECTAEHKDQEVLQAFHTLDADKDGILSEEDIQRSLIYLLEKEGVLSNDRDLLELAHMNPVELRAALLECDMNADGLVTGQDLLGNERGRMRALLDLCFVSFRIFFNFSLEWLVIFLLWHLYRRGSASEKGRMQLAHGNPLMFISPSLYPTSR